MTRNLHNELLVQVHLMHFGGGRGSQGVVSVIAGKASISTHRTHNLMELVDTSWPVKKPCLSEVLLPWLKIECCACSPLWQKQGVKWEDTSKKEEKRTFFPEKEDKKRTFFSLKLIHKRQKTSNLQVNYDSFLIKKFLNTRIFFLIGLHKYVYIPQPW